MSTYFINIENTGLDTDEQVIYMADAMQRDGHDVEFTRTFGLINHTKCPVSDQAWMRYVEQADSEA